ncbi:MAG: methyl-accepting chemotaxis protein [Geobacteraceae bacterium]|nr:methyl-accepting chemotaxis protein [Geobacteraceae bacterium]
MKNRGFFKGLQGKLLLFFLLMSLIPLALVTTISYQKAKNSLQDMGQEMLGDTALGLMNTIDALMNDRQDDIRAWAELPAIKEALKTGNYADAENILGTLEKQYDVYKAVMLFDKSGNVVAVSDPAILSNAGFRRNQADQEWFKRVMAGSLHIHDVYFSASANESAIGFSAPVKNESGQIVGAIGTRVSWSTIEKILADVNEGKTGYAYMLNREGVLIAHPKKDKVLKENLTKNENIDLSGIAGKMVKGETGVGSYTYEGVSKLVGYLPSKGFGDYKGIGWSIAVVKGASEVFAPVYTLRNVVIAVIVISVLIIAVLAVVVARSIANPMIKGVAFAQAVAAGDLTGTLEVRTRDEVGDLANALNNMVASLKEMAGKIRGASEQVASAAGEISANTAQLTRAAHSQASATDETSSTMVQMAVSIQSVASNADALAANAEEVSSSMQELGVSGEQVARSAEVMASSVSETSATIEQMTVSIEKVAQNSEDLASSVSETSATVEQMTVSIDQVAGNSQELQQVVAETAAIVTQMAASIRRAADNVTEADTVAKTAAREGVAGQRAVQEALAAMKRVAEVSEKSAAAIDNLGKRSEEIGNIVKVINEIADQTNLLALNAAIEAARAGDAGRGFAVVADEVRKLAERSMTATGEIGQVIRQVQTDTSDSVRYGELASREAQASMELSGIAGNALTNIVKSISQTSDLMGEIARVTAEQADASGQVILAVERMSQSTSVVANAAREQALGGRQIRVAVERMNSITREVTGATREQAQGSRQIRIAVENMNTVTQQVTIATREQALSARQIVAAIDSMSSMTQSVANATSEQKKGGEMVVAAMENIGDVTRENLVSVEQLARSAEGLSRQADELAGLVTQFRV